MIAGEGKTSILQGLPLSSSKPPFLLWDKVYGKLATIEDELWFVRALSCTLLQVQGELKNNEKLRCVRPFPCVH
jgi:Generalcontrol nonderepressible 1 (Gcn1) N-terminal